MTFPASTGPDGGWSLAHDGGGLFNDFKDAQNDPHAGLISFRGVDVKATTYAAFRAVTALRQFRGTFYIVIDEDQPVTSVWDALIEVQLDDGDSSDSTIMTGVGGLLPSNLLSMQIVISEAGANVQLEAKLWYNLAGAGAVQVDIGTPIYSFTKPNEEQVWIGFKYEVTDLYIKVWIDKNNNGSWDSFASVAWTSPFSSTPFNQVRVMTDDDDSSNGITTGLDSIIIDSLVVSAATELTDNLKPDSIVTSTATRGGGQLTFKYKDPWLADYANVILFYNATLNVTNSATLPFSKYKVVEIKPNINDYDFVCHQVARELDNYPCNHNPLKNQGIIGEITTFAGGRTLIDRDAAFGDLTTDIHYISFGDMDKKKVRMEPTIFTIVEESDFETSYIPADTITPVANTKEGSAPSDIFWQDDTIVEALNNLIGCYTYGSSGGGTFDDHAIRLQGDVHIKENATLISAVLKIDHYALGLGGLVQGGQFPKIAIYDFTNTVWVVLKTLTDADTDSSKVINPSGGLTPNMWTSFNKWKIDIGPEIVDYLTEDGAVNDQDFQKWDVRIAISSGVSLWAGGSGQYGEPVYAKYVDLEILTEEDNFVTQGIAKVSSNTPTVITMDQNYDPSPVEDGIVRGDQYFLSKGRPDILNDVWAASGADSLFTIDNQLTSLKGDGLDYTLTMLTFLLNKYADLEGLQWWQDNDPNLDYIRIKTPEDSGLLFTENNILDHVLTGLQIRGTTKYMRNKIRVSGSYNSFHEEVLAPASANLRVEQYDKSELVTSDQCRDYALQRVDYHQDVQYQGNVPYIWSGTLLGLEVGHTVGVKISDGSKHDYTDSTGSGNLFVKEITLIQDGNKIRATATLTSYFFGIEESK